MLNGPAKLHPHSQFLFKMLYELIRLFKAYRVKLSLCIFPCHFLNGRMKSGVIFVKLVKSHHQSSECPGI